MASGLRTRKGTRRTTRSIAATCRGSRATCSSAFTGAGPGEGHHGGGVRRRRPCVPCRNQLLPVVPAVGAHAETSLAGSGAARRSSSFPSGHGPRGPHGVAMESSPRVSRSCLSARATSYSPHAADRRPALPATARGAQPSLDRPRPRRLSRLPAGRAPSRAPLPRCPRLPICGREASATERERKKEIKEK